MFIPECCSNTKKSAWIHSCINWWRKVKPKGKWEWNMLQCFSLQREIPFLRRVCFHLNYKNLFCEVKGRLVLQRSPLSLLYSLADLHNPSSPLVTNICILRQAWTFRVQHNPRFPHLKSFRTHFCSFFVLLMPFLHIFVLSLLSNTTTKPFKRLIVEKNQQQMFFTPLSKSFCGYPCLTAIHF